MSKNWQKCLGNGSVVNNLPAMQKTQETRVWYLGLEGPPEEEMATTPVLLPGEYRGQRSLADYSPKGHKGSDMTERLKHKQNFVLFTKVHVEE